MPFAACSERASRSRAVAGPQLMPPPCGAGPLPPNLPPCEAGPLPPNTLGQAIGLAAGAAAALADAPLASEVPLPAFVSGCWQWLQQDSYASA